MLDKVKQQIPQVEKFKSGKDILAWNMITWVIWSQISSY